MIRADRREDRDDLLSGGVRHVNGIDRQAVVGHGDDLRRDDIGAVVEPLSVADAVGVEVDAAAVDPEVMIWTRAVEAVPEGADHENRRRLRVRQHVFRRFRQARGEIILSQTHDAGPVRSHAIDPSAEARLEDIFRTDDRLEARKRGGRIRIGPDLHVQLQDGVQRPFTLDQRHPPYQWGDLVARFVDAGPLDEGQAPQCPDGLRGQ